jgi:uncharacterized protein (TIGR02284 family)
MQRESLSAEEAADVRSTLEGLVAVNLGSADLLQRAAGMVTESLYAEMLKRHAKQHRQFAEEMSTVTANYGGQPPAAGETVSSIQRPLAELLTGSPDDTTLLAECDSQEEATVQRYYDALQQSLPGEIEAVIREQFAEIKGVHTHIHRMYEALTQSQERLETTL